ncbi:cytosolic carboxypeptidase 4 [Mugil cephalus]|uniref:cytosolic carboxypeptidase 4 n=1 Tax=Mugil cephalus TaxID=48193 RepID=UPI001FB710D1|nr:cytosolic carboxypeptidase 4 [Mugil cephalus]XP_047453320.1 cytosolic carboxypeptidase 4 [Mugil cephalus]
MTTSPSSSSSLEDLISSLQNAGDMESTLNILTALDQLLPADRLIRHLISKRGSEVLLTTLVNNACTSSPNYTILLPVLHLLAKVGQRDRRIGMKAEEAGAVLLTLNLLKHNVKHARMATACLLVIQVFSSSVSTANLIRENHGLDVIYHLIPLYTTKHLHTIKAAINAFAALLCTKANISSVVSKGYISGILLLYNDWHSKDNQHVAIAIRHALLCCLHKATNSKAGKQAFLSQGGIRLLYQTTQTCLKSKSLEVLVEPSVQLMRKCLPKTPLSLASDHSAYTFPLPGRPHDISDVDVVPDESSEESDEEAENNQEADKRDCDDDLETDLDKLRLCPEPDRPKELLPQYSRLFPERSHDFQELDLTSEPMNSTLSSSNEEPVLVDTTSSISSTFYDGSHSKSEMSIRRHSPGDALLESCELHSYCNLVSTRTGFGTVFKGATGGAHPGHKGNEYDQDEEGARDPFCCSTTDKLLERHGACIPHHDPKLYHAAAAKTKSIPGFSILAFPDFWGHLPPPGHEPMSSRKPNIQRQKVLEDIQRFLSTDDMINQVVFDLADSSLQCRPDSLRFFSKFECGNLRKAIQVRRYEYDLILNADANCSAHTQWFYFEVSNMVEDVPYRFNIINCEKTNSQFNYGMQPVLYSVREALEGRPHWVRTGTEICYFRNHFCTAHGKRRTTFYTLTFTINFKHKEDVCYLAYHYPFTYTAQKAHLKMLQNSVDPTKIFFRQQILCPTLAGNSCPVVTITACPASSDWKDLYQLRNRPYIVLTGRVHPGESNASWVMKGTLEFLCSNDMVAQILREAFVFKIIPMLNPDGVINGTSRCDVSSEDLNRQWSKPDPTLSPTIYHTKGLLYYLNSIGRAPQVFCDYHGHSRKKNVFLYGCSVKETLWQSGSTIDTIGLKEDPRYRTIPKTLDCIAPAFSFNSCNYLVEKSRSATARVVVWREMGVLRSYTMESSFNGCDQGIYKGLQLGTRELQEMGVKFCQSLLSVAKDLKPLYIKRLTSHIDHKSINCFEDDEPPCVEEIEYSTYCPTLQATDLHSDVNSNMASGDEMEECEEGHGAAKYWQGCVGHSDHSSIKGHLFLPQTSTETLNGKKKRNKCNGVNAANGQILH